MDDRRLARILYNCRVTNRHFQGVFAADTIQPPSRFPASMVVNLDPIRRPGSHWVALYAHNPSEVWYFDPLGETPNYNSNIFHFLKTHFKKRYAVKPNTYVIQCILGNRCAHYCIYFLYQCSIGRSYARILSQLGRQKNPDAYVGHFLSELLK